MMGVRPSLRARSAAACSAALHGAEHPDLAAGEARIVGLGRLGRVRAQQAQRRRHVDGILMHDGQGIEARRRIADRGAGADHRGIVARHVGDQQRHHLRGMSRGREAAALDRGQVLSHAIHLGDVGAGFQQRLVDGLLVGKRQPFARDREQGGGAAGHQAQHEVVRGQALRHRQDAARGLLAGGIRYRVRSLDHLDPLARQAVAVARDDEAGERAGPIVLHRLGHGGGGLAGAEHDGAALGRRGQVRRQDLQRIDRTDGRREQAPQDVPIVGHSLSPAFARHSMGRAGRVKSKERQVWAGARPEAPPGRESAVSGVPRRCRRGRQARRRSGSRSGPRPG